ncbi:MAG TPA: BTAD domain-containing putative transcriptional regulator [Actinomycetota bacterium]|nr:BTAD domain-containing putative transcriptional regulator [Actinomycetota bacterium]
MEFRILGSMEVLDEGRQVPLPRGRGRALLALLVLHPGEPVSADRLIDELWGESPPATARTVVHGLVSSLRSVLEPGRGKARPGALLQTLGSGYRFAIEPDVVDAHRFKRLIDEARDDPSEARAAKLSAALGLWRGPALADFTYEPFAQRAITALEELHTQAIEDRIEADLASGRAADLVSELEQLIQAHPFREPLRGLLMLALYRSGRQADALQAYRDVRSRLLDELGLEPGSALRELEMAVLRHDPSLEVPSTDSARTNLSGQPGSWLPRERRTVTVAVLDVAPSARPDADAEVVGRLGAHCARIAAEVIERHGGRVERELGDTLIAFFGFLLAHEDDALRAVRAVADAQAAVLALNDVPTGNEGVLYRSRAGIEVGDIVVAGPGAALRDAVAGPVVRAASRLQHAAPDNEVVVGPAAQRLLRGTVIMKTHDGGPGGITGWQILEVVTGAPAIPRALDAPMFGRQGELTRLRSAFRRAVRSGTVWRLTVLGEAGIGKSRLAREFVSSIGTDANTIIQRCPAPDEGVAFLPVRDAVTEAAGFLGWRGLHQLLVDDHDGQQVAPEIAAAIGQRAEPENVAVLFRVVRRLFDALASRRPLIVVLEDLHWAEPAFLDLVDHLTREATQPILLLCLARPDLLERRPEWGSTDVVELEPLSTADLESLVVDRAGSVEPEGLRRIVEIAEGNPLFAEQLLVALDEGPLGAVPASLGGLLTMRLDRLGPGERDVLRCASIVGLEFGADAVSSLLPGDAATFIGRHLESMEQRRFIRRTGPNAFRFGHALIRMAAYQSIAHEDRAALHERLADWLGRTSPDRTPELHEALGYHVEQAVGHHPTRGMGGSAAAPS